MLVHKTILWFEYLDLIIFQLFYNDSFPFSPSNASTPGLCYSIRISLANLTEDQMASLDIFLHVRNQFLFYTEQDSMPNNYRIDLMKLRLWIKHMMCNKMKIKINQYFRKDFESSFTLTKSSFTSLTQTERQCEENSNYHWGNCLDELFYINKGSKSVRVSYL